MINSNVVNIKELELKLRTFLKICCCLNKNSFRINVSGDEMCFPQIWSIGYHTKSRCAMCHGVEHR